MIEFLDDNDSTAINTDVQTAFTFEIIDKKREKNDEWSPLSVFDNKAYSSNYGDWRLFPYGEHNKLPEIVRNIVYSNSIVPGILGKRLGLNWGKGPLLYREVFEDGAFRREYTDDPQVREWLDSWDYEGYILRAAQDFAFMEAHFTKVVMAKSIRLGTPFIHHLKHENLSRPKVVGKKNTPTHVIIHDVDEPEKFKAFPLFDFYNVGKAGISYMYCNLPSFCVDFFTIPQILGSIPWIIQSTNVPKFLNALTKNSINIKYHITSPMSYWDRVREQLQDECTRLNKDYKESILKKYKRKLLQEIQTVLSGLENAGKFWHSEQVLEDVGGNLSEMGWKITPIEQNMSDTVDANIKIANFADKSVTTGVGVGASLGNVSETGRANGGSEQYYALNNYLQSGIDIPEKIIMQAMNIALKINFPGKGLKMGFYHEQPKRQEDMSKSERNKIAG